VLTPPLSFPPTAADLKNLLIARGQHPFHTKLRGSVEEPLTRGYGIDVGFWGWGRNPVRGLNFKIALVGKIPSYGLDEARPLSKRFLAARKCPVFHHGTIL